MALSGAAAQTVVISEINYNADGDERLEFVELHNPGATAVDLVGWSLVDGVRASFGPGAVLPAGGFVVLARDPAVLRDALRLPEALTILGYEGALENSGERVTLVDGFGAVIETVRYNDDYPFDRSADGDGASLHRACFDLPAEAPFNWIAGAPSAGSHEVRPACPPEHPAEDAASRPVVINEIDYHPPAGGDPDLEFVELLNRSDRRVALGGWSFDRGFDFVFPASAEIGAGELVVVARDPGAFLARYAVDRTRVFGPFREDSRLSNSGETIRLVDDADRVQDIVRYDQEDGWPAHADGLGSSLQRVNALGPSSAAGNWRVAPPAPPTGGDGGWQTFSVDGFYDGPRFYFYLLGAGELLLDGIRLEVKGGDGANLLGDGDFDSGLGAWSATGNHTASTALDEGGFGDNGPCALVRASDAGNGFQHALRQTVADRPAAGTAVTLTFHVKPVTGATGFVARSSVATDENGLIYVEGDASTGQSEAAERTPLAPNSFVSSRTPPTIERIDFSPPWPGSSDEVTVAARVVSEDPIDEVVAFYRVDDGDRTPLPLVDDGDAPDAFAGDGVFTGVIPPAPSRSLVWVSVVATTSAGEATHRPRLKNPAGVTGYYVIDSPPDQNEDLRLFYIFTPGALRDLSCNPGVWREGDLVDPTSRAHRSVGVKFRGETACAYPKRPMRVKFNKGDRFEGQRRLNFNAGWNDKSMLREQFGFDFFRDAGVAHSETRFARVHSNRGVFHGAYFTIEDPNEDYLERNRLDPAGGFYKARTPLRNPSVAGFEPRTDESPARLDEVLAFAVALLRTPGDRLIDFLEESLDVEEILDYQAVQAIIIDGDSVAKNWLLYIGRDQLKGPGPDRISMFPWDIDLSHGQMLLVTDNRVYDEHPLFQTQQYPFHDQGFHGILTALLQRAPGDYFIKAFYGRVYNLLQEKYTPDALFPKLDRFDANTRGTAAADLARWPRTFGARGTDAAFWRRDFRLFIERRAAFLERFLLNESPTTQGRRFRYTPPPRIRFTEIHYNPADDEQLEFLEITNTGSVVASLAGWTIPAVGYTFPADAIIGGGESVLVARDPRALRAAIDPGDTVVLGPYPGRLDNGGAELRLRDNGLEGRYYPETVDIVRYLDGAPWPRRADGGGPSLELVGTDLDNDLPRSWRAGWSPGRAARENAPPAAAIDAEPSSGPAPLVVRLSALASLDPDGDSLELDWSIAGRPAGDRAVFLVSLDEPGTHRVTLTVRDGFGGSDEAAIDIEVTGGGAPSFVRADTNLDGARNLADAVFVLGFLFTGGDEPGCLKSADINDNGLIDLSDPVFFLNFLFTGGDAIPAPFPGCGTDRTDDDLSCEQTCAP